MGEVTHSAPASAAGFSFPRLPIWAIVLLVVAILYAVSVAVDRSDARQKAIKAKVEEANWHAFYASLGAIATPAAFQQRCGKASRVEHLGAPVYEAGTTRLDYQIHAAETVHVYISPDRVVGFDSVLHGRRYIGSGDSLDYDRQMLAEIGCHLN